MIHPLKRSLLLFLAVSVPVNITAPVCDSTVIDANVEVTWFFAPGTQQSYRLWLYNDLTFLDIAYDSGIIVSPVMNHTVLAGILGTGRTYYIRVQVVLTTGDVGTSLPCSFITSFSTSSGVTGLEVDVDNCTFDSSTLPAAHLTWAQVVPSGPEVFTRYDVKRRATGTTTWIRIATISSVAITSYTDYNIMPGVTYEYAVVWVAVSGPSTLVSLEQNPAPFALGLWDHLFIHDVLDPTYFVRYDQWEAEEDVQQQVEYVMLAGRLAPTAQIGERQSRRFSVPSLTRPFSEPLGQRWVTLEELVTRQRTNGSIFCARFGIAQVGVFCQMAISRSYSHMEYEMDLEIVEVNYSETV